MLEACRGLAFDRSTTLTNGCNTHQRMECFIVIECVVIAYSLEPAQVNHIIIVLANSKLRLIHFLLSKQAPIRNIGRKTSNMYTIQAGNCRTFVQQYEANSKIE